jgi:DNA-binding IclR family transcriptional regulator
MVKISYLPDSDSLTSLRQIGLSKSAAVCYLYLAAWLPNGVLTTYIAQEIALPESSIFRGLNELKEKGFVRHSKFTHVASWRAEPLTHALENYTEYQRRIVRPLIWEQLDREADQR